MRASPLDSIQHMTLITLRPRKLDKKRGLFGVDLPVKDLGCRGLRTNCKAIIR